MVRRSDFGTAYMPAATSRDSNGVKNGSAEISCGTTPMAARASRGRSSMSRPQIETVPEVLRHSPARMLMNVDLPAPFGPSRPKIEPRGIARSMPFSACISGVVLVAA
jgi:hypothetical protein